MLSSKHTMLMMLTLWCEIVYAGEMGSKSWDFGGSALFLKPSLNDMRDANARTITMVTGQSSTWSRSIDYSLGFSFGGSYHYSATDDITLNWDHLSAPYSNAYDNLAGTLTTIHMRPQWDAANLEFGKQISLDDQKNVRLHAGVQYARLSVGETEINSASTANGIDLLTPYVTLEGTPTYNGFGMRMGVDFKQYWDNGLCIYANAAGAILAGAAKYNKIARYDGYASPATITNADSTLVVPEIDTKLGLTYTHAVKKGKISIDAGWMFFDYFNVLNQEDLSNISAVQTTNFGSQGPYLGIKWLDIDV